MALNTIQKNRKATRFGLVILALLVIAGSGYYAYKQFIYKAPVQAATETLQTTTAKRGDLELTASGTGSYVAASTASIGFSTSGQIVEMDVKVGDTVEKGQVLAKLDNTTAQIAYDTANRTLLNLTSPAAIATAENAVATAETAQTDDLESLVYLISPQVYSYEQKLAAAQAALVTAQQTAAATPSADNTAKVNAAQTAVDKATRSLKSAMYWYEKTYVPETFTTLQPVAGSRKTIKIINTPTDAQIAAARSTYALAQATLQEAKDYLAALKGETVSATATGSSLTTFEQAKLDLQSAKDTLDATQLVAPISGTITSDTAGVGDLVSSGTIITISDNSHVMVNFYLDETDFDKVAVGYPVSVVFDSLPDSTFTGKVTAVNPSLSDQNGSMLIQGTAELDSISPVQQKTLLLGMTASIDVIGGKATNAVLVSVDALHEIDTNEYGVYVLKNGKLEFTPVTVGLKDSFNAEIKSGLQAGDVVSTGLLETN